MYYGHFSTVWLCRDVQQDQHVAIKIQKSTPHYTEAGYDEVEILQEAAIQNKTEEWRDFIEQTSREHRAGQNRGCHIVQLLNAFIYKATYGIHFCMVFEILGVNLFQIIKLYEFKGLPPILCKKIAYQNLIGLHYIHHFCSIINTDLKPENVIMRLTEEQAGEIEKSNQLNLEMFGKEEMEQQV